MKGRKNKPVAVLGDLAIAPKAPPHFDKLEKAYWRRFTALLINRRLLTDDDLAALSVLCSSFALYETARLQVHSLGAVIEGAKGGMVRSPWVTIQTQAWD